MKIIITRNLNKHIFSGPITPSGFISFRDLSRKEVAWVRNAGLKRFCLPPLTKEDSEDFFSKFDKFWDEITQNFDLKHHFWRNAVSSKMQEWEKSVGYFCIALFTLGSIKGDRIDIALVCDTVQMERACAEWAKINGWDFFVNDSLPRAAIGRFICAVRNTGWFFLRLGSLFYKKILLTRPETRDHTGRSKALIVSYFYKNSFKNGSYQDPVFGYLHEDIKKRGCDPIYLCEGMNAFDGSVFKAASSCKDVQIYTPLSLITFWEIAKIFTGLYFRRIRSPGAVFCGADMAEYISSKLNNFSEPFNINSELFYSATLKLCERYAFNRMICNFEGNVHERACIQAFRQCGSGKIIGYSQAIIFELNLKLRLTKKESCLKPEPDSFVCSGPYAKELLQKAGARRPETIHQGCLLKGLPPVTSARRPKNSRKILVVLDGFTSTAILLEWVLEQAPLLKDFEVILRFHPNMPASRVMRQVSFPVPENFSISTNDIFEDIRECLCVFYRHSSVGILAILNGIPAVHLNIDSPLSGDPIRELSEYKRVVSSAAQMAEAILAIRKSEGSEDEKSLSQAHDFISRYFSRATETELESFIG